MEELGEKQKKILGVLKNQELATTKISSIISANMYQTQIYLEELLDKKLIDYRKEENATYWRLTKKGEENEI